jgi:hypothetical protein
LAKAISGVDPGPPTPSSAGWLTNRRLIAKARKVVLADNYVAPASGTLPPEALDDLNDLIDLIEAGKPIPERYYRSGIDSYKDRMLRDYGINYVHLIHPGSDHVVFFVQFESQVVLLKVGSHSDMEDSPPGSALRRTHDRCLKLAEMAANQASAIRAKQAAAEASLKGKDVAQRTAAALRLLKESGSRRRKPPPDSEA